MKRIKSLVIIIMMIIAIFTGCSKEVTNTNDAPKGDQFTIGIAQFGEHGSLDNCRVGFISGLVEEGFVEGQNLTIINENAQFDIGIANQIAQNFVAKKVDMIVAIATPMAQSSFNAAKDKDIPVVFTAVTDPVAAMLNEGNITGTSDKLPVEAQLRLIRAMLPTAKAIGILYTTSEVNSISSIAEYKEIADQYGFEIIEMGISTASEIPLALDRLLTQVDSITNLTDNTVVGSLPLILQKAKLNRIPVFGSEIEQVKLGAVASEGLDYIALGKQTGKLAAQVLNGEKTAFNIPTEVIEESSLYINSDVLKEFGITLPEEFESRAIDVTVK